MRRSGASRPKRFEVAGRLGGDVGAAEIAQVVDEAVIAASPLAASGLGAVDRPAAVRRARQRDGRAVLPLERRCVPTRAASKPRTVLSRNCAGVLVERAEATSRRAA